MANVLAQRIEETLRPVVGSVLATVTVDVETRRLGKDPDSVDRVDLPAIADNVSSSLKLVVGQEIAEKAARKVRELA